MTVIAVKGNEIAADTANWHGDVHLGYGPKIYRMPDGGLFGAAGWVPVIEVALSWIRDGMPKEDKPQKCEENDFDGIILMPTRAIIVVTHEFHVFQSSLDIVACGAHSDFLYGAMLAGASAGEAVALAIKHCSKAAGEVQIMRV